jgi:hypothetical protein
MQRAFIGFAVASIAAVGASAQATTWTMTFQNVNPNTIVGINYNGARSANAAAAGSFSSVYAGKMNWAGPFGKNYSTFCTQVTEFINFNQTVTFTQAAVQNVPDVQPGAMGAVKATILRDLYARHYADVVSSNNSLLHAAFQAAIWEITHENITSLTAAGALAQLNMSLGAMQLSSSGNSNLSVSTLATQLLAELGDGGFRDFGGLLGLTHQSAQDQLVVVPIPAPVLLAGLGLVGVGVLRRRFSK